MLTVDYILNEGVYELGLSRFFTVTLREDSVPEETFIMLFKVASDLAKKSRNCNNEFEGKRAADAAWFAFTKNIHFSIIHD